MSTGAILLADIIPSFIIGSLSPFLPYNAKPRIFIACLLTITSFLSVGFATARWHVIFGVILTSFGSGLGEPTFLAHSTHFNKNVVSTWSSGTGGAGIIGALSYSLLREIGLNSKQTLLLMLFVPALEFFTFFFLLSKPNRPRQEREVEERSSLLAREPTEPQAPEAPLETPLETLAQKFAFIPKLMVYFVPISLVYFFEYFINQGLVSENLIYS
jgi:battenin